MKLRKEIRKALRTVVGKRTAKQITKKLDYRLLGYGAAAYLGMKLLRQSGASKSTGSNILKKVDDLVDGAKDLFSGGDSSAEGVVDAVRKEAS